jgi:hypothetical protein
VANLSVKQQHPFHHSICTKNSLIRTTHHSDKELYVELKELQEELMMALVFSMCTFTAHSSHSYLQNKIFTLLELVAADFRWKQ